MPRFLFGFVVSFGVAFLSAALCGIRKAIRASLADES